MKRPLGTRPFITVAAGLAAILVTANGTALGKAETAKKAFNDSLFDPALISPAQFYQFDGINAGGQLTYRTESYEYTTKTKVDGGAEVKQTATIDFSINRLNAGGSFQIIKGLRVAMRASAMDNNIATEQIENSNNKTKDAYNQTGYDLSPTVLYTIAKMFTIGVSNDYSMRRTMDHETQNILNFGLLFHNKMLEAGVTVQPEDEDEFEPQTLTLHGRFNLMKKFDLGIKYQKRSFATMADHLTDQTNFGASFKFHMKKMAFGLYVDTESSIYKDDINLTPATAGAFRSALVFDFKASKKVIVGGEIGFGVGSDDVEVKEGTTTTMIEASKSYFDLKVNVSMAI